MILTVGSLATGFLALAAATEPASASGPAGVFSVDGETERLKIRSQSGTPPAFGQRHRTLTVGRAKNSSQETKNYLPVARAENDTGPQETLFRVGRHGIVTARVA